MLNALNTNVTVVVPSYLSPKMVLCRCSVRMDYVLNAAAVALNVGVNNAKNVKKEGSTNVKGHVVINVESEDLIIVRKVRRFYANHVVRVVTIVWGLVVTGVANVALIIVINLLVFSAKHVATDVIVV